MDREDCVAGVVHVYEKGLKFRCIDYPGKLGYRTGELILDALTLSAEFQQDFQFLFGVIDMCEESDGLVHTLLLLLEGLIPLLVLPDLRVGELLVEVVEF